MNQEERPTTNKIPWPVVTSHNLGDNYAPGDRIKVRCIDPRGLYYNFMRRREGDIFELIPMYVTVLDKDTRKPIMEKGEPKKRLVTAEEQFSSETMEMVEPSTPETISTAQQSINRQADEINEIKMPRGRPRKED